MFGNNSQIVIYSFSELVLTLSSRLCWYKVWTRRLIADTSYNGTGQNLTANENLPFLKYLANVQKNTLIKSIAYFAFQYRVPASKILKYNWPL